MEAMSERETNYTLSGLSKSMMPISAANLAAVKQGRVLRKQGAFCCSTVA